MTPFAQLGLQEKSASMQPWNPSAPNYSMYARPGVYSALQHRQDAQAARRPPTRPRPFESPVSQPTGQGKWGVIDNMWGDLAVSSIPFVGSAYMANNAVQDFRKGHWGQGIANGVMAGLSLIPGVGAAGAGLKALGKGAKGLKGMEAAKHVGGAMARGSMTTGPLTGKQMLGVAGAGMGVGFLGPQPLSPEQQQGIAYGTPTYSSPYNPMANYRQMVEGVAQQYGTGPVTG